MEKTPKKPMKISVGYFFLLCTLLFFMGVMNAVYALEVAVQKITVSVQPASYALNIADLSCPAAPARSKKVKPKKAPTASSNDSDDSPLELPDPEDVSSEATEAGEPHTLTLNPNTGRWKQASANEPFRVAFWGDSHFAAGFFTQELGTALGLTPEQVQGAFIPATMNRSGVRLPWVRKTCISSGWQHESAHAVATAAEAPGPSMVNLVSREPHASLAWDLRNAARTPVYSNVRFLYQQTAAPITLGVRVDDGAEKAITLQGAAGPAALEIEGNAPISVLHIRLLSGHLRAHGLGLETAAATRLQLDLFAFPGATVRGWQYANAPYFRSWFAHTPPYQLVVLQYGSNEGHERTFDPTTYAQTLRQSVMNLRQTFPQSTCLLIGPGDRGILVRSKRVKAKTKAKAKDKAKTKTKGKNRQPVVTVAQAATASASPQLLRYSRIHAQIVKIQDAIGNEFGCQRWSMYQAMGGSTSAYKWARQRPQLMSNDLLHFTVAGYQRLGQLFVNDMGWKPETIWLPSQSTQNPVAAPIPPVE